MTKKTKGLSFDEKKQILARVMATDAMYYNFKEIEVIAKKNGIVPQSVKEVLDCLVGDRIVIQEKIGSLNIFWAFSSNEIASLQGQITSTESAIESMKSQEKSANDCLVALKKKHPKVAEVDNMKLVKDISDLQSHVTQLQSELSLLQRSDPATIQNMIDQIHCMKEFMNSWTDNIFIIRQFLSNKAGIAECQINEMFGIPADLDLIDI